MPPMVVVLGWACDVAMAFRAINIFWSTVMVYYRNVPQNICTYSVECACTKSVVSVSAYWVLAP